MSTMYQNTCSTKFFNSIYRFSQNQESSGTERTLRNFSGSALSTNIVKNNIYKLKNSTKRKKVSPVLVPLKQSKYKWENSNNQRKVKSILNPFSCSNNMILCDLLPKGTLENVGKYHQPITLSNSTISREWFSQQTCDVTHTKSTALDLRMCCFIDSKYVPKNTIDMKVLSMRIADGKQSEAIKSENKNLLVELSKHKLVRKQDRSNNSKVPVKRNDSSLVLRTCRKLIRKAETVSNELNKVHPGCKVPVVYIVPETKLGTKIHRRTRICNEEKNIAKPSPTSLVVLTQRKLIRKSGNTATDTTSKPGIQNESSNKLILVNRNKLIRSSLLKSNTKLSKSVLHHMISQRRRPFSRSSYVLLTRNKLIRRTKHRHRSWRKQSNDVQNNLKKSLSTPKAFVSVSKNKLIRKSLFKKNNKIAVPKTVQPVSPFRKTILARILNSPSKRIQRFTNHLSRLNLKYSYIKGRSSYSSKNKRFLNRCKNNRSVFKKKKNEICPVYRRKGICSKHTKKSCPFVHDLKYVALCQKFLKDHCEVKNCPLSHDLIPQKVPICSYYLSYNCTIEGCPFLHSKPDLEAAVCAQFLKGYCELADKCSDWHVFACPEYKNSSTCAKGDDCRLPHRNINYFKNKFVDVDDNWRYFEQNTLDQNDPCVFIIPEKETMGTLPDFIPL